MPESTMIDISLLGGASSIGASCTLIRIGDTTLVVDCGVRYSGSSALPDLAPLAETTVDAVLVTHAHMDHAGGLPVICQASPSAPVFATGPTIDLISILLRDALRLMNSPDREAEMPLYNEHQVEQLFAAMRPVKYFQPVRIRDIQVRWLPAAHILGAAMLHLETPAGSIVFTGDYSVTAQHTVPSLSRPDFSADLVISESTYGQRLHEDRNVAEERLLAQVRDVIARGGRVLIPAFAVGRAQEVLLILTRAQRNGSLADVPVFVDGMVRAVCGVYSSHELYASRFLTHEIRHTPHAFYTDTIQPIARSDDRKKALETAPCIIVSSSGMLSGGPSLGYAQELAKNEKDAILLTGYQDEESPGRALLELARTEGPRELKLGQVIVPVACAFGTYGLSAHADRMQMVSLIEALHPQTVVLVHGNQDAKEAMEQSLHCDDVIIGQDGHSIRRIYRQRRGKDDKRSLAMPTTDDLDIHRVRQLLGPAGTTPLRAATVAEAWFGRTVDRPTADHFARVLESAGLVRRDDHRRDRLWILGPKDTDLFPEEAELEEQLKQTNPKGRLLELCMRMRIDPPHAELEPRGAFYLADMSLCYQGETLSSGPQRAASKKTAEQLAARALLDLVTTRTAVDDAVHVSEDDAARLQSENPKGRLLEWCAQEKASNPQFEQRVVPGGFCIRAGLTAGNSEDVVSNWFVAATKKMAEQAAAEAVLGIVRAAKKAPAIPPSPTTPSPTTPTAPKPAREPSRNAAMRLNELKQVGILTGLGFEAIGQEGPSHQPLFSMVAWATTDDGQR